jgi:glycosyltransferase involved in cell wall biosynthesis
MNEMYNGADIYIAPYSGEGFNLSPLEALTAGCRVAVTDKGGASEYIDKLIPTESIILLPSKLVTHADESKSNKVDLSKSLEILLRESERIVVDTEYPRIRQMIETNFSWKRVVDLYMEYFKSLI